MLGSIWSSAIFPGRCPRGQVLLTSFIGGATDPAAIDLSDGELVEEVRKGLRATMGIEAHPAFVFQKRWGQAIPQYIVGHGARRGEIRARLEAHPGIFLTGSYFDGVSVSDAAAHARCEVDRIVAYLKSGGAPSR
jgi:oxygen-dependent protoporphyrinogen oxidase